MSDDELTAAGITRLPQSLDEALEQFSGSEVLAEAMGSDLFGTVVAMRQAEIARFVDASDEDIIRATRFRY